MAEYFVSAVAVSVILSFITYLSHRFGSEGEVKLASLVLLLYTLTVPLVSLISDFSFSWQASDFEGGSFYPEGGGYQEVGEDAFSNGIKKLINEKYGASDTDVDVIIHGFDFSKMRAERINVYLSGKAAFLDYRGMESYLNSLELGKCEVLIDIG